MPVYCQCERLPKQQFCRGWLSNRQVQAWKSAWTSCYMLARRHKCQCTLGSLHNSKYGVCCMPFHWCPAPASGRSIIWFILIDLFWLLDQQGLDEFLHEHTLLSQQPSARQRGNRSCQGAWHYGSCASGGSVPWYLAWTKVCLLHPLAGTMDQSDWEIWRPLHTQRCFVTWSAQTTSHVSNVFGSSAYKQFLIGKIHSRKTAVHAGRLTFWGCSGSTKWS